MRGIDENEKIEVSPNEILPILSMILIDRLRFRISFGLRHIVASSIICSYLSIRIFIPSQKYSKFS